MIWRRRKVGSNAPGCANCAVAGAGRLNRLGLRLDNADYVVALAGNPNTGKSTIFNALTGLRQHTGNWPGKTIARAEGGFETEGKRFKLVDLPGTYSLLSASPDEEVARDFILFGRPDVTVIVVDATRLERNLNLVLQILQITDRVVVALNLIDEARAHGLEIDHQGLEQELGVPVIPTAARFQEGMDALTRAITGIAGGSIECRPRRLQLESAGVGDALEEVTRMLEVEFPGLPHKPWIALRLLEGDPRIVDALTTGELEALNPGESLAS